MTARLLIGLLLVASGCRPGAVDGRLTATALGDLGGGPAPRVAFDEGLRSCGDLGPAERGAGLLRREPYLQQVSGSGALVRFTSASPLPQLVRVTLPDGTPVTEATTRLEGEVSEGVYQQSARLAGLQPGSLYCYEVLRQGQPLTRSTGFRTAAADSARFIAMGDLGSGGPDQLAVREQLKTVRFDLALLTGDIGVPHGRREDYEQGFFSVYHELLRSIPFFAASGNHDYDTDDAVVFRQIFAAFENGGVNAQQRWYSFDWGPLHVAVLDTEKASCEQAAWLDADLRSSRQPWKLVVMHEPIYSSGVQGGSEEVRRRFLPVFRAHGVDLVLSGHDHNYERTHPVDGVTYIVTGGGGSGTRPVGRSAFTAFSEQVCHFVYGVADRWELRLWAIDATGQTFDTAVLRRSASTE